MDQRRFLATVLSVILLGISVTMGVNMVVESKAASVQADIQVEQPQDA